MLNIGHRGAMGHAPENTLLSIRKAMELGADWIEIDVHLVDGALLVIHDDTLERTTSGRGKLTDYRVKQLRAFDAGQGECIPTLQEVIDVTQNKAGLNIELKGVGTGRAVVEILQSLSDSHRNNILLSSFVTKELEDVRSLDNTLKMGVLASDSVEASFQLAARLNAISIHLSLEQVSQGWVSKAHKAGLLLFVYTVNEGVDIRRMKQLGVDGVYSNFPDRVKTCD